jgi:hypothetical protein
VYFTNLWKQKPFLPYGCLLTRIFRHFKVPLTNEKYIEQKEFFDQTIFKRMKIKYLPPLNVDQTEPSDPTEPSISEPSPSATPSSHAKRKKSSTSQDNDEVMQRLEALELHQHTFREDVTQQLSSIQKEITSIKDLLNSLFWSLLSKLSYFMGCNTLNLYLYFAYAISALTLFDSDKGGEKDSIRT